VLAFHYKTDYHSPSPIYFMGSPLLSEGPSTDPTTPEESPVTTDETSKSAGAQDSLGGIPLPGRVASVVAVAAPGEGPGNWAGASSAALEEDGTFVIAYRVRNGHDGTAETVIARSEDGERFTTVATLEQSQFGAKSMERPSLVRTERGRWRLYVCCADPGSPHWWIDAIDAEEPEGFAAVNARTIFPGDDLTAVKDPLVQRTGQGWRAWICCHLLDQPGEEDRMNTAYATSEDGLRWEWHGVALEGRPGAWDARGARVTAVLPDGRASYDGRATAEENFFERTGLAYHSGEPGRLRHADSEPVDIRYLDVLPLPDGAFRIYYEARLPDESHELRTEIVPPQTGYGQEAN
jgi:hypothetical protein